MNTCSKCGKELPEGTAICADCGTTAAFADQTKPNISIGLDESEFQAVVTETVFRSTHGTGRTFPLNGKELNITADMDALNEYRQNFRKMAKICADTAAREYTAKVNDLDSFIDQFPYIYRKYLDVMGDKAIQVLVSESIFSITREEFSEQHQAGFHLAPDSFQVMLDSIQLTKQQNRAVGGTFQSLVGKYANKKLGISEETFAEITDEAVDEKANTLTDMQKAELYGRIKPHILFAQVFFDYWHVYLTLVNLLRGFGHNIWLPDNVVFENSKNIFKNISNPNFPQDKITDVLFDIIHANPYNEKYYEFMGTKFGNTEEVANIKAYFGYPEFGEGIYSEDDIPKNEIPIPTAQDAEAQGQANGNSVADTLKSGAGMLKNTLKNAGSGIGGLFKGFGKSKK